MYVKVEFWNVVTEDDCGRVKRTGILPAYRHTLEPLRLKPNINREVTRNCVTRCLRCDIKVQTKV
jgi:hypothetical protein